MAEFQAFSVEHQAREIAGGACGVERIAEDRVADGLHMHPQLVGAAGFGEEAHPRGAVFYAHPAPISLSGFAGVVVHMLQGAIGPVDDQRQVDLAFFLGDLAPDAGDVGLFGVSFLELQAEVALCVGRAGEDHDARGIHIEAVNQEGFGEDRLQAREQAIREVIAFAGDRQEACGFVDQKQFVIFVQDIERSRGRRVGEAVPNCACS